MTKRKESPSPLAFAVLLYVLLKPVGWTHALVALCFRLVQTAVLGANLLNYPALRIATKP